MNLNDAVSIVIPRLNKHGLDSTMGALFFLLFFFLSMENFIKLTRLDRGNEVIRDVSREVKFGIEWRDERDGGVNDPDTDVKFFWLN